MRVFGRLGATPFWRAYGASVHVPGRTVATAATAVTAAITGAATTATTITTTKTINLYCHHRHT